MEEDEPEAPKPRSPAKSKPPKKQSPAKSPKRPVSEAEDVPPPKRKKRVSSAVESDEEDDEKMTGGCLAVRQRANRSGNKARPRERWGMCGMTNDSRSFGRCSNQAQAVESVLWGFHKRCV